jgi:hypothetical protein
MITDYSKTSLCCSKFWKARERMPLKIGNLVMQSQKGSPALSCDNKYRPMTEQSGINARNEPIHNIWGYHDTEVLDYGLLGCDALWEDTKVSNEFPPSWGLKTSKLHGVTSQKNSYNTLSISYAPFLCRFGNRMWHEFNFNYRKCWYAKVTYLTDLWQQQIFTNLAI